MSSVCVIVIPCYNEAGRLRPADFLPYLRNSRDVSLLFVDDGSTDRTLEVLRGIQRDTPFQVSVLHKERNGGKAEAVRDGLLHALSAKRASYVGFWDADLATPLEAIDDLLQVFAIRPTIHMVFGSRVSLLGRKIDRRGTRHYLGRVFATCASLVLSMPIYDTQCGAKLFRVTPDLMRVLQEPFSSPWIFDVELIARFLQLNAIDQAKLCNLIFEFPLHCWRDVPGSKVRAKDFLRSAGDLFRIWNRYIRSRRKAGHACTVPAQRTNFQAARSVYGAD